jgi:putative transposase
VTKYRHKVINAKILHDIRNITGRICETWGCSLLELNGEPDHIHLLFDAHPNLRISGFVNNLKTVTSRLIRKQHAAHILKFYWKPIFWHRSYCIVSAGGAPLEIIKQYIQSQDIA